MRLLARDGMPFLVEGPTTTNHTIKRTSNNSIYKLTLAPHTITTVPNTRNQTLQLTTSPSSPTTSSTTSKTFTLTTLTTPKNNNDNDHKRTYKLTTSISEFHITHTSHNTLSISRPVRLSFATIVRQGKKERKPKEGEWTHYHFTRKQLFHFETRRVSLGEEGQSICPLPGLSKISQHQHQRKQEREIVEVFEAALLIWTLFNLKDTDAGMGENLHAIKEQEKGRKEWKVSMAEKRENKEKQRLAEKEWENGGFVGLTEGETAWETERNELERENVFGKEERAWETERNDLELEREPQRGRARKRGNGFRKEQKAWELETEGDEDDRDEGVFGEMENL